MVNNHDALRDFEPMCALDPLLLIPRIEYVDSILACVMAKKCDYTLVILDMKNFHLINDVYDYNTGDEVLSTFIMMLRVSLPNDSFSLRFRHGDEFLFFIPTQEAEAESLFTNINLLTEQYSFLKKPDGSNFPIAFRFATMKLKDEKLDYLQMLKMAESRLRVVKGQGTLRSI